nr:hypothetical protein [Victivallales bacterium]
MDVPAKKKPTFTIKPGATKTSISFRKPELGATKVPAATTQSAQKPPLPQDPPTLAKNTLPPQHAHHSAPPPPAAPKAPPIPTQNPHNTSYSTHAGHANAATHHQPAQAPVRRVVGVPLKVENMVAQKTGIKDNQPVQKAPTLDKTIEAAVDEIKDQIQNYIEVCDTLSRRPVDMDNLVEILFVMTRSLNFDFLILLRASPSGKGFCAYHVRGLKANHPDMDSLLEPALSNGKISWNTLIKITSSSEGKFAEWMRDEKISSVGHVPFHDGDNINGLMIVGSYEKKNKTQIASQILELCGSRIG